MYENLEFYKKYMKICIFLYNNGSLARPPLAGSHGNKYYIISITMPLYQERAPHRCRCTRGAIWAPSKGGGRVWMGCERQRSKTDVVSIPIYSCGASLRAMQLMEPQLPPLKLNWVLRIYSNEHKYIFLL